MNCPSTGGLRLTFTCTTEGRTSVYISPSASSKAATISCTSREAMISDAIGGLAGGVSSAAPASTLLAAGWVVAAPASPERSSTEPPQAMTKIMLSTETVDSNRMVMRIGNLLWWHSRCRHSRRRILRKYEDPRPPPPSFPRTRESIRSRPRHCEGRLSRVALYPLPEQSGPVRRLYAA